MLNKVLALIIILRKLLLPRWTVQLTQLCLEQIDLLLPLLQTLLVKILVQLLFK